MIYLSLYSIELKTFLLSPLNIINLMHKLQNMEIICYGGCTNFIHNNPINSTLKYFRFSVKFRDMWIMILFDNFTTKSAN